MSEVPTVILGAACGYSPAQLAPFLKSLEKILPQSRTVLFVQPGFKKLTSASELHVAGDSYLRPVLRKLPRGTRFVSGVCLATGRAVRLLQPLGSILMQAAFGVAVARYFWYRNWLEKNPGPPEQAILLSDTRDVVFQGNPFIQLPAGKMFCGVEPISLGNCEINSGWYKSAYGSEALDRIGSQSVLCSGVIGGPRELIHKYLIAMCAEIDRVGYRILWSSGFDQAIHNHLLRNTDLGKDFILESWDGNRLTTLHYASASAFRFNQQDELVAANGEVVSIVHQYDRHESLRAWVSNRWSNYEDSESLAKLTLNR